MPLQENIFLVSDASYCYQSKVAGLSSFDLYTGRKHYMSKVLLSGKSREAEFAALVYSIYIAIQANYNNVVFIYDDITLDTDRAHKVISGKIKNYQFLWLKRSYVDAVDKVAKKARLLHKNMSMVANKKIRLRSPDYDLQGFELLEAFKDRDSATIIKACCAIANSIEKECLDQYLKNKPFKLKQNSFRYEFFNFVYFLVSTNNKSKFYEFLNNSINEDLKKEKIVQLKKQAVYIEMMETILTILKKHQLSSKGKK